MNKIIQLNDTVITNTNIYSLNFMIYNSHVIFSFIITATLLEKFERQETDLETICSLLNVKYLVKGGAGI